MKTKFKKMKTMTFAQESILKKIIEKKNGIIVFKIIMTKMEDRVTDGRNMSTRTFIALITMIVVIQKYMTITN